VISQAAASAPSDLTHIVSACGCYSPPGYPVYRRPLEKGPGIDQDDNRKRESIRQPVGHISNTSRLRGSQPAVAALRHQAPRCGRIPDPGHPNHGLIFARACNYSIPGLWPRGELPSSHRRGLTLARVVRFFLGARHRRLAGLAAQASAEVTEAPLPQEPGIEANPQNPEGNNHFFLPTTCWTGEVNGRWYEVYAGAKRSPAGEEPLLQSELHVYEDPVQERASSTEVLVLVGKYVPPAATKEALTITGSQGDVLTIKTEAGASLKFNLATSTFE
jgi:hypothetical protein